MNERELASGHVSSNFHQLNLLFPVNNLSFSLFFLFSCNLQRRKLEQKAKKKKKNKEKHRAWSLCNFSVLRSGKQNLFIHLLLLLFYNFATFMQLLFKSNFE